jgi:glycosyltransferase involved in cell wall biosynthesis
MDIYPLIKPNSGPDYHRLTLPFKTMGLDLKPALTLSIAECLEKCKVVVYNRTTSFDYNLLLSYRRRYGFKILLDLDDYWILYPGHIIYDTWKRHNITQKIREGIMNADFVTCTTSRLATEIEQLNPRVEVVPNALPFDKDQFTSHRTESDKFRILYAGGTTHLRDLRTIKGLFDKLGRFKPKLEIGLAGYSDSSEGLKRLWDSYVRVMKADKTYGVLPLDSYMNHYDNADLSIAPLEANYFNGFKSNLKVLEAGCKYLPIITSACPPYSDEKSELVWMADSVKNWYTLSERCIKNPNLAKEQGQKLGEYVREKYDLYKVNELRKQIFNHLIK